VAGARLIALIVAVQAGGDEEDVGGDEEEYAARPQRAAVRYLNCIAF
jgi:hypothetical protein